MVLFIKTGKGSRQVPAPFDKIILKPGRKQKEGITDRSASFLPALFHHLVPDPEEKGEKIPVIIGRTCTCVWIALPAKQFRRPFVFHEEPCRARTGKVQTALLKFPVIPVEPGVRLTSPGDKVMTFLLLESAKSIPCEEMTGL